MNMGAMTPMTEAALASHVGEWIYDADGSIVGSLERLRGAREAVVHVSTFFMGGNKLVVMPIEKLGVVDGKAVVHDATLASLEALPEVPRPLKPVWLSGRRKAHGREVSVKRPHLVQASSEDSIQSRGSLDTISWLSELEMEERSMRLRSLLLTGSCLLFIQSVGEAADQVSFLNKTTSSIGELHWQSPTRKSGDQINYQGVRCLNEQINLPNVQPGDYDVKVHVKFGPTCIIHKIAVKSSEPFSISDSDLKECTK